MAVVAQGNIISHNGILISPQRIILKFPVPVILESGISLHVESLARFLLGGAVDLSQGHFSGKEGSDGIKHRSELHAVAAPWSIKLEQPQSIRGIVQMIVEIFIAEGDYGGVRFADFGGSHYADGAPRR